MAAPRKKKIAAVVKVQLNAGAATPAPPVGTALGPHGVNIMDFCKQYNAATESQRGNVIPVEITIYEDRSFSFITKTPPAPELIKKAAGVAKGSGQPNLTKVGSITAASGFQGCASDRLGVRPEVRDRRLAEPYVDVKLMIYGGPSRSVLHLDELEQRVSLADNRRALSLLRS